MNYEEVKDLLWEEFPTGEFTIKRTSVKGLRTLRLQRGKGYRIHCEISAEFSSDVEYRHNLLMRAYDLGRTQLVRLAAVEKGKPWQKLYIHSLLHLNGITHRHERRCTLKGDLQRVVFYVRPRQKTAYRMHWFLNAPDFGYTQSQNIDLSSRIEYVISNHHETIIERHNGVSTAWNAVVIPVNGADVALGSVPKEIAGDCGGSFIRVNEKDAVAVGDPARVQEVFQFASAQRLTYIGTTSFNSVDSAFRSEAVSTFREDTAYLRHRGSMPLPFSSPYVPHVSPMHPEEALRQMMEVYARLRDTFPLQFIFAYISGSWALPLELKIQPLATAFDLFRAAWFRSDRSASKGKNLKDETYTKLITPFLAEIQNALGEKETTAPIINRIKKANEMTQSEKNPVMFREMGLEIGEIEEAALRQRHSAVHGSTKIDHEKLHRNILAFETLLNRMLLRLMGFSIYLDANDRVVRKIEERQRIDDHGFMQAQ